VQGAWLATLDLRLCQTPFQDLITRVRYLAWRDPAGDAVRVAGRNFTA
jgi:hypothetical protein